MLIKNRTSLATMSLFTTDEDGDPRLGVIAKGAFEIRKDERIRLADTPAAIRVLPVPWHDDAPSSIRYEDDLAPFKPCTDVIVNGTAWAPPGKPMASWRVGVRVGNVEKTVTVTGPRAWVHTPLLGWSLTEPVAIRRVPLRYELAFGGAGCDANPVGCGHVDPRALDKAKAIPAPQLLTADGRAPAFGEAYPVEGFGAIAKPWQPRRARAGTFDEAWRQSEGRRLPADFDVAYWNAAHPDLCADGFLRGNEEVTLWAMHPEHEMLRFRLPNQVIAVGVVHASGFRHGSPAQLDTVFIDADAMRVELTWRASMPLFKEAAKSLHIAIRPLLPVGGAS